MEGPQPSLDYERPSGPDSGLSRHPRLVMFSIVCLILGALPLLIYPFVAPWLLAALAFIYDSPPKTSFCFFVLHVIIIGALSYPVVQIPCALLGIVCWVAQREPVFAVLSVIPLTYVLLLVILGACCR